MHFLRAAFVCIGLVSAAAGSVVFPEGLGDGIWTTSLTDNTGNGTWTKLADIPEEFYAVAAAGSDGASVEKRDNTGCTDHYCAETDYVFAFQNLWNECAKRFLVASGSSVAFAAGNSIWYVCNYNANPYTCYQNDMTITLHSVEYACGKFKTGFDYLETPRVAFGVEVTGVRFC